MGVVDIRLADGSAKTDTTTADTGARVGVDTGPISTKDTISDTDTAPTYVCGNGKCEAGESATTCPADCKVSSGSLSHWDCGTGLVCQPGASGAKKYGTGYSTATDQAFMSKLTTNASLANAMTVLVSDCTLKKGCLVECDAKAKKDCITTCIATDSLASSNNVSTDCASCFGVYKGFCGADKCIAKCAAHPAA